MEENNTYNPFEQELLRASQKLPIPNFNADMALKKVWLKTDTESQVRHLPIVILRFAAALLIGLFMSVAIYQVVKWKGSAFAEITTGNKQKRVVDLPDGSKLWLNANSRVKYPQNFKGLNRRIEVWGEAFLEITNREIVPVVVSVNNVEAYCDSAGFNIRNQNGETSITVEHGKVAVYSPGINDIVEVEAGICATFTPSVPLALEPNQSQNYLAWKTNRLEFDNTPLQTVASEMSEYYGVKVSVRGDIRFCNLSSSYSQLSISEVLNDIKAKYRATINSSDNEIVITGRKCN